jgi:hypothetical protein
VILSWLLCGLLSWLVLGAIVLGLLLAAGPLERLL